MKPLFSSIVLCKEYIPQKKNRGMDTKIEYPTDHVRRMVVNANIAQHLLLQGIGL